MDARQRIADFLDRHHVMSLATVGPDGPHAASVFYARIGFCLFWVSSPKARHSVHIEADPRTAATVAPDTADFSTIRGVQLCGNSGRVRDAARSAELMRLLEQRYPFLSAQAHLPHALRKAWRAAEVYQLTPAEIVLTDNARGFGHKESMRFDT
jgi:uncharacterized protein YhbP (UPF0306 family)